MSEINTSGAWYDKWMRPRDERLESDTRSIEELLPLAKAQTEEEDSDKPSDALAVLQHRANKEIFDIAKRLCESDDPKERVFGAHLLSQNVVTRKNFPEEKFDILFGLLENETDIDVLATACHALAHIRDPRAIEPLVRLKDHPSKDVRFAVTHGMWSYGDDLAIKTLIELSTDEDDKVRDWATFGLGSLLHTDDPDSDGWIYTDTPEIREALAVRLDDAHEDTRFEAVTGLALRKDRRAIEPLIKGMEDDGWNSTSVCEAAAMLANPSLLPALLKLKREGKTDEALEAAIEACEKSTPIDIWDKP